MRNVVLAFVLVMSVFVAPAGVGAIEYPGEDATGAVYGTVEDAVTGHPIAYVCVRVTQGDTATDFFGFTNAHGVYEISGMPVGVYDLTFEDCERGHYGPASRSVQVVGGSATPQGVALSLAGDVGAAVGAVVDAETQAPLPGVCVKLYHASDDVYVTYSRTDEAGRFQVNATAGDYRVRFKPCEAERYLEQWYDGATGWDSATPIRINAAGYHEGVDAALVPNPEAGSVVWGYLVEGDTGEPVHGYCVSLFRGETKSATVLTGEAGGWEMAVDPGSYRVKAWACEGHEDLGTVWYLDGHDFGAADVVEVGAGTELHLETMVIGDVRFRDVLDSAFHEDIVWLAREGITVGCNDDRTEFCPAAGVTRAQMAAFLHRALGHILEPGREVAFDDIEGSTFQPDIEWLGAVGVTLGCDAEGTRFCPEEVVTRGEMAAFLHRALDEVLPVAAVEGFVDDDQSTFERDIEWLAAAGVTAGCDAEGTRFCPDDPVIRAHMAAFLHRALRG